MWWINSVWGKQSFCHLVRINLNLNTSLSLSRDTKRQAVASLITSILTRAKMALWLVSIDCRAKSCLTLFLNHESLFFLNQNFIFPLHNLIHLNLSQIITHLFLEALELSNSYYWYYCCCCCNTSKITVVTVTVDAKRFFSRVQTLTWIKCQVLMCFLMIYFIVYFLITK